MSELSDTINRKLLNEFGYAPGSILPMFKVTWSSTTTEKRKIRPQGIITIFDRFEVKECLKVPWCKDRWMLERWYPTTHPDIVESDHGVYEPIYIFTDKNDNFLPLNLEVARIICKGSLQLSGGPLMDQPKAAHTASYFNEQDVMAFAREVKYFEGEFGNEAPNLSGGAGVVVPHNYGEE